MSVPKLISPLLDGFVMGDAVSDHHGVRCCPAMRMSDSGKYIVKIISVPASQTKLDALLLAGAFSDRAAALDYYRELSQDLSEEAALLERCSRLEGFVAYEGWQVEPMEDGCGFDVYLLAPYRTTLDRLCQREPLTHLQAVNLGLDLCSALASCRRSGWIYAALKPENICICPNGEYRIGDLGFLRLPSLPYTSLPERHHSNYTVPEVTDAYSALNATLDTYALGLILYQIFNGGNLPETESGQKLRAPEYADTQMAQILLKACAPDPAERWEDPVQMGQALVSYLQSHTVNDTPIIPQPEPEPEPEPEEEPLPDEFSTEAVLAAVNQALENATIFPEEPEADPAEPETEDAPAETAEEEPAAAETEVEETETEDAAETEAEEVTEAETEEAPETEEVTEAEEVPVAGESVKEESAETVEAEDAEATENESAEPAAEEPQETPVETEEKAEPEEGSDDWTDALVSEEFSPVMEQADDLIAHELPAPVVVPEHVDLPEPVLPDEEEAPAESEEPAEPEASEETPAEPEEDEETEEEDEDEDASYWDEEDDLPAAPPKKRKLGCFVGALITLLLLALLATAGYVYYNHYYLQSVQELHLTGSEDQLTVRLDTAIDNALLTVYCTDPYGNAQRLPVIGNTVTFTGLRPRTRYKIHVEIDGFHKLIGVTSDTYITDEQTVLSGFTAVAGDTDGSAILSFTVQGPEAPEWKLLYSCPGESERQLTFSGHMVNVTGLTPGSVYTFRIEPAEPLYVVGDTTLEYTATRLVYAHLLSIQSFVGGKLTAVWLPPPEGVTVNSWTVRCAGTNGVTRTCVVTEPIAVFEGLDPADAYTVQVTAEGMTVSATAFITANSVTIDSVTVDDSVPGQITLNWTYQGTTPKDGWLVLYNASGYPEAMVIRSNEASATISPVIPGMLFEFTIQSAEGSTVFGGHATYEAPAAEPFAGFMVTAENFTFHMCRTPQKEAWGQADVSEKDYVDTFAPGEKASFVITLDCVYGISEEEVRTLAVIWDEYGIVVDTITVNRSWSSMWYKNFGKLDLFELPETPGFYTIEVYFNEAIVTNQSFIIAVPEA